MPLAKWESKQLQIMESVTHGRTFEIAAPLAELFPLFNPEGEKAWVPGWDYENVMGTTELSEDYVFLKNSQPRGGRSRLDRQATRTGESSGPVLQDRTGRKTRDHYGEMRGPWE